MREDVWLAVCFVIVICVQGVPNGKGDDVSFVVGGNEATPGSWPWQAILYYKRYFQCGAVLIGPKSVLTAAHCVAGANASDLLIVLGDHNVTEIEGLEQVIGIKKVTMHPFYDRFNYYGSDIAMLTLTKAYTPSVRVKEIAPTNLWSKYDENSECYITGYGATEFAIEVVNGTIRVVAAEYPVVLMEAQTNIISKEECEESFNLQRTQICVAKNNTSACFGDSGGPLVCRSRGDFVLVGLTSLVTWGCDGNSIYTELKYYRQWIRRVQWYNKLHNKHRRSAYSETEQQ